MHVKHYFAGSVYNTIVRVSVEVVEEVVDGLIGAFNGCCLLIHYGIDGANVIPSQSGFGALEQVLLLL